MRTVLMSLFAVLAMSAVMAAESPFRADVKGLNKLRIDAVEGDDYILNRRWEWLKPVENQAFNMEFFTRDVATEWTDVSFAFEPEAAGTVEITFKAQWAQSSEDMGWIQMTNIRVNGEAAENGNMADNDGKNVKGYRLVNGAKLVKEAGPDGASVLEINHDAPAIRRYNVEAGKTYVFTVAFKCIEK